MDFLENSKKIVCPRRRDFCENKLIRHRYFFQKMPNTTKRARARANRGRDWGKTLFFFLNMFNLFLILTGNALNYYINDVEIVKFSTF